MFLSVIPYWKNEIQAVTQPGRNAVCYLSAASEQRRENLYLGTEEFLHIQLLSFIFWIACLFFFFIEYWHTCFNPPSKPGNMP